MSAKILAACAALALSAAAAAPASASAPAAPQASDPLPSAFLNFFYQWKSEPKGLKIADVRVFDAGGELRVLCGDYALPGQAKKPFLVLGDASPAASAAWEPGSFPESDPLYPQLMDNLRLCQTLGAALTAAR